MPGWETELEAVANDAYYMNPSMIRFLLAENLALKTLLHDKGILSPEEFEEYQQKAAEILDAKTKIQLKEHLKRMAEQLRQRSTSSDGPSLDGKTGGGNS